MANWTQRLSERMAQIGSMFLPDELAYLALTQKIEHAIRDKLAFSLHHEWAEKESLLVCREWNRIDIAVLDGSTPVLLLEAKAQYTFDIVKDSTPHNYPELLLRDVRKVAPRRAANTEVFTLLLATHPYATPDRRYRDAVKYFSGVAAYSASSPGISYADEEISRRLVNHPRASWGEIKGGSAFGIPVSVAYWLFGPYANEV